MRRWIIFIAIILLLVTPSMAANTTEVSNIWEKPLGSAVTSVDTNEHGTLVIAGLANGSIVAYNSGGDLQWQYHTNGSIKKVVSDSSGNVAWSNQLNETGYITLSGASQSFRNDSYRNISDIEITTDGSLYTTTELYPPRIMIYKNTGELFASNATYPHKNWSNVGIDSLNGWLVASNQTDSYLYLWNITNYTGWLQFNPTKDTKNSSLSFIDSFPYRRNISFNNLTTLTSIYFINTTNTTSIQQLNNSYFEYNALYTGNYFYWTSYGNMSDQSTVLNSSLLNGNILNITFKPTSLHNLTLYYGNKSHTPYYTGTTGSTLYSSPGGGYFTVPAYVTYISYQVVGGGGNGARYGGHVGTYITGGQSATSGTSIYYYVGGANGTTTFNTTNAAGGAHNGSVSGNGDNGYFTSKRAASGLPGDHDSGGGACVGYYNNGTGGVGQGAGGGGGGYRSCTWPYGYNAGGAGNPGGVYITYTIPSIVNGISPIDVDLSIEQNIDKDNALLYIDRQGYVGNISKLNVPEGGGGVGISTDSKVYYQYITVPVAFGSQIDATANSGMSYALKSSDGGSFTTEGRGIIVDIYDITGTRKGTYTTGGVVRSVDIAQKTSLWTIAGGDDGKVYFFSKDDLASWYVAYSGDSENAISTVAMSWRGEYGAVGRIDGSLEYYYTLNTPSTDFSVLLSVYKDSMMYAGQNITVYESEIYPYVWTLVGTGYTDSSGSFTTSVSGGKYYRFVVNSGEGETIYQATSSVPRVTINVLSPSTPYEWNAYYDESTNNVTYVYTDSVDPTYVNVSITDMKTGLVVATTSFTTKNYVFLFNDPTGSGSYQVTTWISRNSNVLRDQRIVTSPKTFRILLPNDNVSTYFVSMFALMVIAGTFGYLNSRRGAFAVVIIAALMIFVGLLPWNMWSLVMLTAMAAVASLLGGGNR